MYFCLRECNHREQTGYANSDGTTGNMIADSVLHTISHNMDSYIDFYKARLPGDGS